MANDNDLPRIAVVLDFGAASPLSILAAARRLCQVVFVCDYDLPYLKTQSEEVIELATVCDITGLTNEQAAGTIKATGITTFSEYQLTRTADLAESLGFPTYHTKPTARALTDKFTQRRTLHEKAVQTTRCRPVKSLEDLQDALEHVGLPAILKPRTGAGGSYTFRVTTAHQAKALLREFLSTTDAPTEYVLEELLTGDPAAAGPEWGDYVSVESVTSRGITRHIEITGKFPLTEPYRETGYFVPATLGPGQRPAVLKLADEAIMGLGITDGVTHLEIKLTPDGPRIIEMNGRLGGYVADIIRRARGLDLVRMALQAALGQLPDLPEPSYRSHAFQYFILPPMGATRLASLADVPHIPGIHLIEIFKQPGDRLDWKNGTLSYLGIVHGSAASHRDIQRLIRQVNQMLQVGY
jgi:biotin carboxylase